MPWILTTSFLFFKALKITFIMRPTFYADFHFFFTSKSEIWTEKNNIMGSCVYTKNLTTQFLRKNFITLFYQTLLNFDKSICERDILHEILPFLTKFIRLPLENGNIPQSQNLRFLILSASFFGKKINLAFWVHFHWTQFWS